VHDADGNTKKDEPNHRKEDYLLGPEKGFAEPIAADYLKKSQ
jgi:hypothetical protein